mgnify:CR=1 FL=1
MKLDDYYKKRSVLTCINECDLNFNKGNVVKYVCRAGNNPNEPEFDALMKAFDYLIIEINKHVDSGFFYLAYTEGKDENDDQ